MTFSETMQDIDARFANMIRANIDYHAGTGLMWDSLREPARALCIAFDIIYMEALYV